MTPREALSNRERIVTVANGWVMLPLLLALVLGDIGLFIYSIAAGKADQPLVLPLVLSLLLLPALIVTDDRAIHSAAERGARSGAFRRLQRHGADGGIPLGQSLLYGGGTSPAARVAAVQAAVKGDTAAVVRPGATRSRCGRALTILPR
jgi:hypothetical protein